MLARPVARVKTLARWLGLITDKESGFEAAVKFVDPGLDHGER